MATCATVCASPCRPLVFKMTVATARARGGRGANVRLKLTPFRILRGPQPIEWELQSNVLCSLNTAGDRYPYVQSESRVSRRVE